jgi:DNA-directed RNA polymerase subunit K/omega
LVESNNKDVVTALREIAAGKVSVVEPEEKAR